MLGPIGDMATRIALHQGFRVIGVDLVPERLERARGCGAEVIVHIATVERAQLAAWLGEQARLRKENGELRGVIALTASGEEGALELVPDTLSTDDDRSPDACGKVLKLRRLLGSTGDWDIAL